MYAKPLWAKTSRVRADKIEQIQTDNSPDLVLLERLEVHERPIVAIEAFLLTGLPG